MHGARRLSTTSEQRAEPKDAIIGFLSAAERVDARRLACEEDHRAVCSGTLAQAAHDYTNELNRASQELHQAAGAPSRSSALSARELRECAAAGNADPAEFRGREVRALEFMLAHKMCRSRRTGERR
jgi:hypothetical protein